jgi:hypothetical protein
MRMPQKIKKPQKSRKSPLRLGKEPSGSSFSSHPPEGLRLSKLIGNGYNIMIKKYSLGDGKSREKFSPRLSLFSGQS